MRHGSDWTMIVGNNEAARRAGGRRRYNLTRRFEAMRRQWRIVDLLSTGAYEGRGRQSRIAEQLGVHRSTVSRDLRAILFPPWPRRRGD
jgi:hypothetical protein